MRLTAHLLPYSVHMQAYADQIKSHSKINFSAHATKRTDFFLIVNIQLACNKDTFILKKSVLRID